MSTRILFVDDEENILSSYKRILHDKIEITTLTSAREGLLLLESLPADTFAIIVTDFMMPEMNGLEFIKKANTLSPHSVKVMLTGYADLETSIQAINEGHIFRFLTKPCPSHLLIPSLNACLHQYNLVMAEKQILRETLQGSISLMSELLSACNPNAFGKGIATKRVVSKVLEKYPLEDSNEIEIAALLSQIGYTALPEYLLKKVELKTPLSESEQELYNSHPDFGRQLLKTIPRLGHVADIIAFQNRIHDRSAPEGSRVIHLVQNYLQIVALGGNLKDNLTELKKDEHIYGPYLIEAFEAALSLDNQWDIHCVSIMALKSGMILAEDLFTQDENLLCREGCILTDSQLMCISNYYQICKGLPDQVRVRISK